MNLSLSHKTYEILWVELLTNERLPFLSYEDVLNEDEFLSPYQTDKGVDYARAKRAEDGSEGKKKKAKKTSTPAEELDGECTTMKY